MERQVIFIFLLIFYILNGCSHQENNKFDISELDKSIQIVPDKDGFFCIAQPDLKRFELRYYSLDFDLIFLIRIPPMFSTVWEIDSVHGQEIVINYTYDNSHYVRNINRRINKYIKEHPHIYKYNAKYKGLKMYSVGYASSIPFDSSFVSHNGEVKFFLKGKLMHQGSLKDLSFNGKNIVTKQDSELGEKGWNFSTTRFIPDNECTLKELKIKILKVLSKQINE